MKGLDQAKDYPLILRNDVYDIRREATKPTPYWKDICSKRERSKLPYSVVQEIFSKYSSLELQYELLVVRLF